jgi:vibriolysin
VVDVIVPLIQRSCNGFEKPMGNFMNCYKEFTALGLIGALMLSGNAVAAVTLTDVHQLDVKQINKQYQKANTAMEGRAPKLARQRHAEMLRLEVDAEFAQLTHAKDRIGQYYRYQQTFRGIPVFGKQILVSEDSKGNVRSLFGHRVSGLSKELPVRKVKISALQALNFAKRAGLGQRQPLMKIEGESVKQMIYLDQSNNAHMT